MGINCGVLSFICIVLIITSLYHYYFLNKCKVVTKTLNINLKNKENINNNLYNQYVTAKNKHNGLKKIASNRLFSERNLAKDNEKHAIRTTQLIPGQYNRIFNNQRPITI